MAADVRLAGPDDIPGLGRSLARAFRDDPIFTWAVPGIGDDERARRLEPFFRADARIRVRGATAWCSGSRSGAALWAAPGRWRTGVLDGLRLVVPMIAGARRRAIPSMLALSQVEKVHPKAPHWYLAVLGTDPDHQGTGIGTALLEPVLATCDRDGVPAYLESSKASNVPYYERFGWKVTGEIRIGKDGPTIYPMWRDPS